MATLTNTKIKDTYVGLLKTTDNEAIDAAGVTLLEDGAGNASALSVGRASNGVTITGTATATAFAGPLTGNVIGNVTGNLTGTVLTAAQTNITSVGTLTSLSSSGNINADDYSVGTWKTIDWTGSLVQFGGIDAATWTAISLHTSGSEKVRIDTSGNVGIGGTPAVKLDIAANNTAGTALNVLRFTDIDTSCVANQPTGRIEFFTSESDGSGVSSAISGLTSGLGVSTGQITFETAGTEKMRILAGGGLTFNGDTAAANALDDYEEGTFTPVYTTADGDFDTIDYSIQEGNYTKIGRVVYCDLFVRGGNITYSGAVTSSSNVRIGGLPFTAIGGLDAPGASISHVLSWANTNNPNAARQQPATTQINLHQLRDTANVYTIKVSDLNSGAANTLNDIRMSFFYNVP